MIQEIALSETKPSVSSCHTLLDFQATLEAKPEKAIKLEKDALALIKKTTEENAHLVSNLHSNLGGLYRMNSYPDLAREHMEKGLFLLERYNLLYTNDSIPQITNYAMFLAEQQSPSRQPESKPMKPSQSSPEIFWNITAFTTGLAKDTKNLSRIKLWTKNIIF